MGKKEEEIDSETERLAKAPKPQNPVTLKQIQAKN